eukprot:TRINITY_DN6538_c1_g3_i1.p1 TRINITY_DN6538_c1_g3~~TRINITY_DN6538_c1_g3_i1.p1  ORF type:complete len:332 (+),score=49.00 TRINITY_DN6538_c1_g3_i1:887-1882(+)
MGKKKGGGGGGSGPALKAEEWPLTRGGMQKMAELFTARKNISSGLAKKILEEAHELISRQPTVVDIVVSGKGTASVVGDTHGQVTDVIEIFQKFGLPTKDRKYIFNGDYVDRGDQGCEVVLLLCGWLLCDPTSLTILRGNHEDRSITLRYGFAEEARTKYGSGMYDLFISLFAALPLSAVVNDTVIILHGGLFRSPEDPSKLEPLQTLRDISNRERQKIDECPDKGIIADVLWSDPTPDNKKTILGDNDMRGSGCHFADHLTTQWLDDHNFTTLIRSHEGPDLQDLSLGYSLRADDRLITVFSARNYCGSYGNSGCVVTLGKDCHPRFQVF